MKKVLMILAAAAALAALVFGIMIWRGRSEVSAAVEARNAAASEYNDEIVPYNEAVVAIGEENARLQGVLDKAQELLGQESEAYEPKTRKELQNAVRTAANAFAEVPAVIEPFEMMTVESSFRREELRAQKNAAAAEMAAVREAEEKIPPVPEVPDYTEQINQVKSAQKVYADSVQKLANVTAPPDQFVRERLQGIGTVVRAEAVTAEHDPNGLLGKKDGYTGCVYFLDERISRDLLPQEAFPEEGAEEDLEEDPVEDPEEDSGEEDSGEENSEKKAEDNSGEEDTEENSGAMETGADSTGAAAVSGSRTSDAAAGNTASDAAAGSTASDAAVESSSSDAAAAATAATASDAASTAASAAAAAGDTAEEEKAADEGPKIDVVLIGTEGGGAVEIFATREEAEAREAYLEFFKGSVMDPGSHAIEGTCVIRTSKYLDDKQQEELTKTIREALLKVE